MLDQRGLDFVFVLPRAGKLKARHATHAVAHRADFAACDIDFASAEELDVRQRRSVQLFQQAKRVWSFYLVTIELTFASLVQHPHRIKFSRDIVASPLGIELHPICARWIADQKQTFRCKIVENGVTDDVALGRAGKELLCGAGSKRLETIDA